MDQFLDNPLVLNIAYSVAALIIIIIIGIITRIFIKKIGFKLTAKSKTDVDDKILQAVNSNLKRIIILIAAYVLIRINGTMFNAEILKTIDNIFYVIAFVVVFSLFLFIVNMLLAWYLNVLGRRTDSNILTEFSPLIERLVKAVVFIVGLSVLLDHFGVDIQGLIVSLGVGSLALAFAAQDTLGNMIAGFVIMIDRPFRKGDRIKLESGVVGDVYSIGLRSIKIIDFENTIHIIPNKEIANRTVINYSYPDTRIRVKINVGVAYGSDIEQVKNILIGSFNNHADILSDPEPMAYFTNMGDSALDFMVVGRVELYTDQWRVSEELRTDIYNKLLAANIDIPFPQRTLHISDDSIRKLNKQ